MAEQILEEYERSLQKGGPARAQGAPQGHGTRLTGLSRPWRPYNLDGDVHGNDRLVDAAEGVRVPGGEQCPEDFEACTGQPEGGEERAMPMMDLDSESRGDVHFWCKLLREGVLKGMHKAQRTYKNRPANLSWNERPCRGRCVAHGVGRFHSTLEKQPRGRDRWLRREDEVHRRLDRERRPRRSRTPGPKAGQGREKKRRREV